ncbi:MAG: hypothetical protein ACLP50_08815 [Solirubrobacteraceae bacterium]
MSTTVRETQACTRDWGRRAPSRPAGARIGVGIAERLPTGVLALCLLAVCAWGMFASATAQAQTYSTVQSQFTYSAYNPWTQWEWWQPNKCTETQTVYVSQPSTPGQYPVLIYLHGTWADWGGNQEGQRVAQLAAAQGFLVAAPTYDSMLTLSPAGVNSQAKCVFGGSSAGDALGQVCALPQAACSQGVLVSGFSQGGAIAALGANYSPLITAAWLMGVSGPNVSAGIAAPAGTRVLPDDRLRIDVGQADVQTTNPNTGQVTGMNLSALNAVTGLNCSQSPCLQTDGSGYYVVTNSEVADGVAGHCYWMGVNMSDPGNTCTLDPTFDPGFVPPSTVPWSLLASLNWLRGELASSTTQHALDRRARIARRRNARASTAA